VLVLPALINGFPFVYSDTGTYLSSAVTGYLPYDRPYWYGGFMGLITGHGRTLWPMVAVQTLLCAAYTLRTARLVLGSSLKLARSVQLIVGLTAFSSVAWYASLLIPDIFTGLGLLAAFGMMHPRSGWLGRLCDALMMAAAIWFHASNLIILPLAMIAMLFIQRRDGWSAKRIRAWHGALAFAVAIGGLAIGHGVLTGRAYLTSGSHVFLMGRMIDTGMLSPYLKEHCPGWEICAYAESLPPHSQDFLWAGTSPLAKQGGWEKTKDEYGTIVRGSFTEPKYLLWHVRGSIASTVQQLGEWRICRDLQSQWYRVPDSAPRMSIKANAPHLEDAFMGAMQNGGRGELRMAVPDWTYRIGLLVALLVCAWALLRDRAADGTEVRRFMAFALVSVLIGAWACASLSVVDPRYLGRDSWLVVLAAMLWWLQRRARPVSPPTPPVARSA